MGGYVPILKGKAGEWKALAELDTTTRSSINPLLELLPVPPAQRQTAKNPDPQPRPLRRHLEENFLVPLAAIGDGPAIWLDLDAADRMPRIDGMSALDFILNRLPNIEFAPVLRLGSSPPYRSGIASYVAGGVVLRLSRDELDAPTLGPALDSLLNRLDLTPADVDVVFDLGKVDNPTRDARTVRRFLRDWEDVAHYRSATLAGGAFPESLTNLGANSVSLIARHEWAMWELVASGADVGLSFGDYGPLGTGVGVPYEGSPNIRYTLGDDWLVLRGAHRKSSGINPGTQRLALAKSLRQDARWQGAGFSWGDTFIDQCRPRSSGGGSSAQWVSVAVNHHIEFVVRQLANPDATAGAL